MLVLFANISTLEFNNRLCSNKTEFNVKQECEGRKLLEQCEGGDAIEKWHGSFSVVGQHSFSDTNQFHCRLSPAVFSYFTTCLWDIGS